jgi:cytochrome c oxidase subunit 2
LIRTFLGLVAFAASLIAGIGAAMAAPQDWEWGFQDAVSPIMHDITSFYDWLLVMMVVISALVAVLLLIIVFRFRKGRNPEPSRTSHNTMLEILWTTVPVLILVAIAVPSLRLLYFEEAAGTASRARARLRWCRCRTPARRTLRGSRCGCRRTQPSHPAG